MNSYLKLLSGDCVTLMNDEIAAESVDLVFADPPYNLSGKGLQWKGNTTGGDWYMVNSDWDRMSPEHYVEFTESWLSACKRVLKSSGAIYVCCTFHNLGEVLYILKKQEFRVNNVITWYKSNAMPNMTKRTFTHACEYIVWAVRGKGWTFNYEVVKEINPERRKDGKKKQMRDLWTFPLCQGKERLRRQDNGRALHPTQKPEALVERAVLSSSQEGETVLDPFLGSGTTAVVALRHNRSCIGIEQNSEYLKAARKRVKLSFQMSPPQ